MAEPIATYVTRAPRSAHLSSRSTIANDCIRPWPIDHRASLRQTSRRAGLLRSSPARQKPTPPVPNYRVSLQGFTPVLNPFLPEQCDHTCFAIRLVSGGNET